MIEKIKNIFNKTKHKDMINKDIINDYKVIHRSGGFYMGNPKLDIGFYIMPSADDVIKNHIHKSNNGYVIEDKNKSNNSNEYLDMFIDNFINELIMNKRFNINKIFEEFKNGNNLSRDIDYPMFDISFNVAIDEKIIRNIKELLYTKNNNNIVLFNFLNNHELIRALIKNGYGVSCYIGGLLGIEDYYAKEIEILISIYPIATTKELMEYAPTGKECYKSDEVLFFFITDINDKGCRLFNEDKSIIVIKEDIMEETLEDINNDINLLSDNDELINGKEFYNRAINYLAKDKVEERDHNLYYETIIDTINYEFDINDNRTIKFINDEFNRILNEVKSIDKYYIEYKCDIIHSEKHALFEFFQIKENDLEKTREIILNIINEDKGFSDCIKNNELIKKLIINNYSLDFTFEENKNDYINPDNINEYCLKLGIMIFCDDFDRTYNINNRIKVCYKKHNEEYRTVHKFFSI